MSTPPQAPAAVRVLQPHLVGRTNAARDAADYLAAQGHHVHYVASGETRCHTGHCTRKGTL
ncbi:hypothetical protein KME66_20430 [Streptomyces sp. YPW6]|uniref:hypothetical protein n=1 Tax=Streptomyces sp. YPW6 TaxID=2840373 RepID=UPI001C0DDC2D|nr:hypothetical protein [Streptomyces sp. YPW6]QWQ43080.1 hypothetical protein KME66_20430 [Streptomyces sp. YPW6]